jgi:hypothetical protein
LGLAAIAGILEVSAAAAANKCVDAKGRVTYQDTACEKPTAAQSPVDTSEAFSTKPSPAAPSSRSAARPGSADSAYANAHGQWRGPAQFQLTLGGVRDSAAQAVTPMVIELKSDGEVVGVIPGASCALSGLASQFVAENMASVDVTLKGCKDPRFNTRYTGHLMAQAAAKEARLNLHALVMRLPNGKFQQTSIEAVLRR